MIVLKDSYTILAGDTTVLVNHSFLRVMNAEKLIWNTDVKAVKRIKFFP